MAGLPAITWIRFFVWLAIGLCVYFFYSRKRSEFYRALKTVRIVAVPLVPGLKARSRTAWADGPLVRLSARTKR